MRAAQVQARRLLFTPVALDHADDHALAQSGFGRLGNSVIGKSVLCPDGHRQRE
jgi:hypothetical protein